MKVGLISAIFNPLTNGAREIKFDLLFNKKKVLLRSGNISIAIINEAAGIITISVNTDFFNRSSYLFERLCFGVKHIMPVICNKTCLVYNLSDNSMK